MKLQHLAIIFVIIILPISLVMGEYIASQIDTIYLQTQYSKKLQDATYDAIKAFQLNTINSKYSSISDSKIRDIEASINTFYTSLGTSMGASGYDSEELKEYIPAIVYTMYDGYYIYSKYYNYDIRQYQYGLKPYIYYACRYKSGQNDFVVNYTLDNSITIYGNINGEYVTKSGYVINPTIVTDEVYENGKLKSIKYNGIEIEREILTEQLITIDDNGNYARNSYQYTKYNSQKIYKDSLGFFICTNNKKQYLTDTNEAKQYAQSMVSADGNLYNNSAVEYYYNAREFSNWLKEYLGKITQEHTLGNSGERITDFTSNTGSARIFDFNNENNPMLEDSVFNQNRISVIRKSIETNLISAIANYNVGSSGTYQFQLPVFTEEDWDKLLNNISISVFMQGMPIKSKYFNNYCIITNNKNKEIVTNESIYILAENMNGMVEAHLPGCTDLVDEKYNIKGSYNVIDFERQTVVVSENNEVYYYPQTYNRCYNCIVNVSKTYNIDDIISGENKYKNNIHIRKAYLTALARERNDLYKTNGYF